MKWIVNIGLVVVTWVIFIVAVMFAVRILGQWL